MTAVTIFAEPAVDVGALMDTEAEGEEVVVGDAPSLSCGDSRGAVLLLADAARNQSSGVRHTSSDLGSGRTLPAPCRTTRVIGRLCRRATSSSYRAGRSTRPINRRFSNISVRSDIVFAGDPADRVTA